MKTLFYGTVLADYIFTIVYLIRHTTRFGVFLIILTLALMVVSMLMIKGDGSEDN